MICLETFGDNSYALTDEEYKFSLGKDYVFFEIMEPEQLAYTYKVSIKCQMFIAYDDCVSCGYSFEDLEDKINIIFNLYVI